MKNSLKTKVLAGTITVALLSSAGFAFANTDAGGALKSWYSGVFDQSKTQVQADVEAYREGLVPELQAEFEGMKTGAENDINFTRDSKINAATTAINSAKAQHVRSLNQAKQEIIDDAGRKFYYDVFLVGVDEINRLGNEAQAEAQRQLTDHTAQKGSDALAKVTADLTAAKEQAVSDLEEAIRVAKEEINAEVENQQEITTRNLKNRIDFKLEDMRKALNGILDKLVVAQQQIIETKAAELQADALRELDSVVSGINN